MLERYSHIRITAKREAVNALATLPVERNTRVLNREARESAGTSPSSNP